jgi:predicted nucleotidyltransferase
MLRIKSEIKEKLPLATEYLKSIGCKEIILFGSLANGDADESSDIDLAVSGISPRTYFKTVAEISSIVGWKVDLVTMDHISKEFKEKIRKQGRRLYAG